MWCSASYSSSVTRDSCLSRCFYTCCMSCRCTVANRELTIQLGKRPTLMPEMDSLVLLAGQTVLYDVLDPTARFTGSRVVAMCSNCENPEASVFGPAVGAAGMHLAGAPLYGCRADN